MEKLKYSTGLRWACYILIPILVLILGVSILYTVGYSELGYERGKSFYQTNDFATQYSSAIYSKVINNSKKAKGNRKNYKVVQVEGQEVYFELANNSNYYTALGNTVQYMIIDEKGSICTNINYEDFKDFKAEIAKQGVYWSYENGIVETSVEKLQMQYFPFEDEELEELEGYTIYTTFDESKISIDNSIYYQKMFYDAIEHWGMLPCYLIPILSVVLLLIGIYLLYAIGHEKKTEEIYLERLDEWPYELVMIIGILLLTMLIAIAANTIAISNIVILFFLLVLYLACYVICAVLAVTTIKRIKAKRLLKSFLIYKILRWMKHKIIEIYDLVVYQGNIGKTISILYAGFIIVSAILECFFFTGIGVILLLIFWGWTWKKLLEYGKQVAKIKEALESIYQGKTDIHLEEDELKGALKQMVVYINDIAGGFSNAIEESLKSERLKTELITNVSHDIKTPLTSIINYVDLLKKENIQDQKVQEYLEILDKKSQRLKRLTEDLVEASKASSGNVTLNIEKMNVKELMKQTIGEFKEKFEEKNLQIELELPEEDVHILADNKYMYRVIENLYSNITKYALENSRVYFDVIKDKKKLKIQMKNISKEKLNISADELMQRFVRGDKARTTEGSGLGLSISKSLTELQKGSFQMVVDGDLFKVELEFDLA